MIRFLPDTWRDALLRPLAMAAPDAGVYIEIMAPDFRFLCVLVLLISLAIFGLFGRRLVVAPLRPSALLLAAVALSFIPWLGTTGNGRYFIALLLAVGPLCIAMVYLLPMTRGFRLSLALVLVALQTFAVQQSSPWQSWSLTQWKEPPFFDVELPQDMESEPATYVTMSNISYSLIAPRFPNASHWMSLTNAPAAASGTPDGYRAQKFLARAAAGHLTLLIPSIPAYSTEEGMPDAELFRVLNMQLAQHHLALREPHGCRLLRSSGMASLALRRGARNDMETSNKLGFWACPLKYPVDVPTTPKKPEKKSLVAVFTKLEQQCPRFFAPGQTDVVTIPGGEMRIYPESEMKIYAYENGPVLYKYYRALNPVLIGTLNEVLSGKAKVDCNNIQGRSGLPWEREI